MNLHFLGLKIVDVTFGGFGADFGFGFGFGLGCGCLGFKSVDRLSSSGNGLCVGCSPLASLTRFLLLLEFVFFWVGACYSKHLKLVAC